MQTREERENRISDFSAGLNINFNWFYENFVPKIEAAASEFWGSAVDVKLLAISENTNILSTKEEFFVTQIRLTKELSVFIRLSKPVIKGLLECYLGSNGQVFNIEKLSELEAKILTAFDNFIYENISPYIKKANQLPQNTMNYNECHLTLFLKNSQQSLGKIIIKIPVIALEPQPITVEEEKFSIDDFLSTSAYIDLLVGTTLIRLNDLKNLEKDDIVVLENSNITKMILKYNDYRCDVKISPNPVIMTEFENDDDNGGKNMTSPDIYNMWDSIQVEIGAEFEKVKLSLGELKQISEGLVVDIGSVYDNKIDLKVEDKIVASGELVIINDRYGVKINQIFTQEKNQASSDVEYSNQPSEEEIESQFEEDTEDDFGVDNNEQTTEENTEYQENINEEDFDYSDFDVDEEDI